MCLCVRSKRLVYVLDFSSVRKSGVDEGKRYGVKVYILWAWIQAWACVIYLDNGSGYEIFKQTYLSFL